MYTFFTINFPFLFSSVLSLLFDVLLEMIDNSNAGSSGLLSVGEKSAKRHVHFWRVVGLCFALAFVLDGGAYLQVAPRMEIIESIICKQHFPDSNQQFGSINSTDNASFSIAGQDPRCKEESVQSELAYLYGIQQLLDVFPSKFSNLQIRALN
jgi:hypothetical protein